MNPYTMPANCDVCGGEGVGTVRTAAAAWLADSFVSHTDPRVCADNLRALKKRDAEREAERTRWKVPT